MNKSQKLLFELIKRNALVEDKTKLAKLQYFADFIHYAFNDAPISDTNIVYTRQAYGPLSRSLTYDLNTLISEGLIEEKPQYRYKVVKDVPTNLTQKENKTIDYVLSKYGGSPSLDLIRISHEQAPYLSAKEQGVVELFTAYNLVDEYTDYATAS